MPVAIPPKTGAAVAPAALQRALLSSCAVRGESRGAGERAVGRKKCRGADPKRRAWILWDTQPTVASFPFIFPHDL